MMRLTIFIFLSFLFAGCARHVISEEALRIVDRELTFPALQADPEEYKGKHVVFGGMIASLRNTKEGSQLEVVQSPLGSTGEPLTYQKDGRFLAVTPEFLDPVVYKKNRYVTLFGEVQGQKTKPVDEYEYRYPVILIKELYLWDDAELRYTNPSYPPPWWYYDPFFPYDPYWPSPYWHRPYGPPIWRW